MYKNIKIETVRPCRKAMNLLEVLFTYPIAWKLAGKRFRNKLFGKFEFEYENYRVSVPIERAHWPKFKDKILQFHE